MNKKLTRTLAGVMSLMFMGQVMIFGDGSAQGLLHADTIASAAEAIEGAKNKDQLAKEFEEATKDLGKVDYFDVAEDKNETANNEEIAEDDISVQSESDEAVQDHTAAITTASDGDAPAGELTVTGIVKQGVINGIDDKTPIYVRIFDENWNEIEYQELRSGDSYSVTASSGSGIYHVKYESDGYLPFYLKDFGTGTYTVGSGDSRNTVTLVPGDTTWNEEHDNEWSDDVINGKDLAYVQSCLGAYRGDDAFNFSIDLNGNGIIDQEELLQAQDVINSASESQQDANAAYIYDLNGDAYINHLDMQIMESLIGYDSSEISDLDFNGNGVIDEEDLNSYISIIYQSMDVYWYNLDLNHNGVIDENDAEFLEAAAKLRGPSDNYYAYMDKDDSGTIDNADVAWFSAAYKASGDLDWDHAFKRTLIMQESGAFQGSLNLHDTDLNLNGCSLYVGDCMSFTTDIPKFWSGNQGATLNISNGYLEVSNNLVFRTASPDGWGGNAGQLLNINGGLVIIGGDFNFGQANCYDTMLMTVPGGEVDIYGNWNYNTLTDMEGKWTAGTIYFEGPTWEVNEKSGEKSVYSTGDHVISLYYPEGVQTILWDNRYTYIYDENGNPTTKRHLNFDYYDEEYDMSGLYFPLGYSPDRYHIRPWFPEDDAPYEPDYTLYRKGWEIGEGVHIATGNYTKSFTDLSIESPGVTSDFVRTYNSISTEESSFGIGWDFNIDVSKIVKPTAGYYQVVLPDGSNTTFKDNGKGGFECLNAHSTMTKSGNEYTITNAAQSKYHFNTNGELDWVKDAEGNVLTISSMTNNQRIVTDSTGRTYTITYNGNKEHSRITSIKDTTADRVVTYAYNGDFQLVSATSVSGGTETYEYDKKGKLCKITNCYDEVTDQISYLEHGQVDCLTNASGLKQVYTYNKLQKQTGLKEYDKETLVKTFTYNYDEKYAVKTNTVETDGQTYEVDKITYNMVDGKNKYDEMSESVDIMGNTTKYERDTNGNVIKTINADGTYTLANYNDKNSVIAEVDESGNATIKAYDSNGTRLLKEATSLHPLSQTDINTVTADNFDPVKYLAANEASYAITSHEYYADSYVSGIAGLIRATTDPEGNVTEYDYYKDGVGKGLVKSKTLKDGNTVVNTVSYEYNAQLQVSKETTSFDISKNLYSVKEYEYDKFNNVTVTRDYGTGSTPATTIAEYDLLSRKTAEYAPNYSADKSHGSLTTYYPDGNKKSETDAEGNITSYVYDAYGQVIKKTNPDGTMNLTAYDGLQREKATYFLGSENGTKQILTKTSYEFAGYNFDIYSALDASASHSCKGLKTTKTTYITENKQVISEMLTDIKEHTIYEKTNGETKRTSAYYANGQLARQTDALGNITKYEYGYLNKVTKTYTPFNTKSDGSVNYSVTENQYDKNGNVTLAKQTVQKQDSDTVKYSVTENQYNAQGLLTQVTLSDGTSNGEKNITKYFYNNASIQTKMYTGLNSTNDSDYMTTNYEYDAWGHLVRTTDSTGYNSGATTYDLNGNVLTSTDANGNVTTNTYDALNRVLTANTVCSDTSKNVSKSYVYDNMGRVRSKTANGVQTSYQYDIFGRVYQELSPKSFKGYFYEGISQYAKEQLVGINHQTMYSSTQYEYDAEMRIAQVKESGNLTATYTYDANGNKVSETLANGVVSTYSYNGCNKVTKLVTKSGNSDISSYEYSYYLDGSDACKVRNENGTIETTSYDYDGLKRLTRESISNGKTADTYSYEYDDYGNRSKMVANGSEEYETVYDYTVNGKYTALLQKEIKTVKEASSGVTSNNGLAISPTDLITGTTTNAKREETAYSYDANGNQITKITADKTETNTYDSLNQLIGFTDGKTTASYKYDVDGLRISKTVDGHSIDQIWNDDKQIAVDADGSNPYKAQIYIRGTNLLAGCEFVQAVKSDYTYYTQNAHGDVVNLTDNNGAVTKAYQYDAFGVEKNIDDTDTNAFRYCGEYYDKETATIYLRARYYSPSTGRFISRDSFAGSNNDPLSLNLYTYCHNNPVSGTDSTGHFLDTFFDAASLAFDIVSFCIEPTPMGAVDILTDVVGLVTPGVPSAGLKVGVHAAETAYDAYKAVDTAHDLSKAADVAITVSKKGDTVLELADAAKDAKKASSIADGAKSSSKVLTSGKPHQIHHFATNKSKKYTPQFEKITKKYNLDLDGDWNKMSLPHQGRHPYAYHDYVLDSMKKYDSIAKGDQKKFLSLYEQTKTEIANNPEMLYKNYWKKRR
ncbi:RHS repeat-associated core domain-containing protein [uncultured Ruminococcus sp.]|uniref:RHS repeat-associated core domain-containing protein n=1 Tax=uncultured Ruminococcus sp. TaxID=165186 RepID=UPI0026DD766B|nr:RHS repeat-associated core domain-containing protein [uncultured Ruminococcus sp.]